MKHTSFASLEYAGKTRRTRREKLLGEMDNVAPWARLEALTEPRYPKSGKVGRPPIGVPRMLCTCFLQQWYTLADEALDDTLYDSQAMHEFVGIDLAREQVPDATTLLKFRRLLEQHDLTAAMLAEVNAHLTAEHGLLLRPGTVVDATIIAAPSSTKNEDGKRDPEMYQARKGNRWHFGMKAHIGVDAESGLAHTVKGTAADINAVVQANALLHGEESDAFVDAGYQGAGRRPDANDDIEWHIAMRPGRRRALDKTKSVDALVDEIERLKASVRAKVEHPFRVVKRQFGHVKVRYRRLKRNTARWSGATRNWSPMGPVTLNPERDSVVMATESRNHTQPMAACPRRQLP
ncbi:MAG: IS5 family transposase [Rubrivivax sp.]|nr:IS5 family transposase [Rubrivivax sp.]